MHRRHRSRVIAAIGTAALVLSVVLGAAPQAAATAPPGPIAATPSATGAGHDASIQLTLITGDRLEVVRSSAGDAVTVSPAPRPDGTRPAFQQYNQDGHVFVIPADITPLLGILLDRSLFDVTAMLDEHQDDTASSGAGIIVEYGDGRARSSAQQRSSTAKIDGIPGVRATRTLESIGSTAATVDKKDTAALLGALDAAARSRGAVRSFAAGPLTGVTHIWRDAQVHADDATSAPQIGAPAAWSAGYTGQGVSVAVLDTGIDTSHPDLQGKVTLAANFSTAPDTGDHYGHGTHVASIIAGSGAASGGTIRGIAYGATLLNGKVLDDNGFGDTSAIIDGMEWAAQNGAKVINLSLGVRGAYTDGTDPGAMAVNNITDQYGTLVVVAAGNDGPGTTTVTTPGSADKALTVAAVDSTDTTTWFSSRGPRAGDYGLKPDITAPGNEIIAARAAGTSMGNPVDQYYTAASGTSMATPHVVGAAAILLSEHPGLTAASVKSMLMGAAHPINDTIWNQGAGRLDVATAIGQTAYTTPASLSFGAYWYPQTGLDPVVKTLTYRNDAATEVEFALTADLRDANGNPAAANQFSLNAATVKVPAHGSADVLVTVDPTAGDPGLYAGAITATAPDGRTVRTTVGFYKEDVRYQLTITGIDNRGNPATSFSTVDVLNVDDASKFAVVGKQFDNGTVTLRVPPGHYSVLGYIGNYEDSLIYVNGVASVMKPELTIGGDTSVVLDARTADPVQVKTPLPTERFTSMLSQYRGDAKGAIYVHSFMLDGGVQTTVTPTDPVTIGKFEAYSRYQLRKPILTFETKKPVKSTVPAVYADLSAKIDGKVSTEMVYAGIGRPEDFAGLDVRGKIALIQRGTLLFVDKIKNAQAAGARAVLIFNNVPGTFFLTGDSTLIPTLKVDQPEGLRLKALTDRGPVTVDLVGTPQTPYTYDVMFPETAVPANPSYVVSNKNTAQLAVDYRAFGPDSPVGETRHMWRPYDVFSAAFQRRMTAPVVRTEYLSSGDSRWAHYLDPYATDASPFNGTMLSASRPYAAGERASEQWLHAPLRSGLKPWLGDATESSAYRQGDTIGLDIASWVDDDGHFTRPPQADSSQIELYRDGQKLVSQNNSGYAELPVPHDAGHYRLVATSSRDVPWWPRSTTTSTWEFDSGPTAGAQVLPLVDIDYRVTGLDATNRAAGKVTFEFTVGHQQGSTAPAGPNKLAAWWSVDDGATWAPMTVKQRGDGPFTAKISPRVGSTAVSIKVRASDASGATLEQQITRAFGVG